MAQTFGYGRRPWFALGLATTRTTRTRRPVMGALPACCLLLALLLALLLPPPASLQSSPP
eukprot:COSAG06_NODE_31082_length_527_cov_0.960280_1_plen_59_part_10